MKKILILSVFICALWAQNSYARSWGCASQVYIEGIHKFGDVYNFMDFYWQGDRFVTVGVNSGGHGFPLVGELGTIPGSIDFDRVYLTGIPSEWRMRSGGFFAAFIDTKHRCKRALRDQIMTRANLITPDVKRRLCPRGANNTITVLGTLTPASVGVFGSIFGRADSRRHHVIKEFSCNTYTGGYAGGGGSNPHLAPVSNGIR